MENGNNSKKFVESLVKYLLISIILFVLSIYIIYKLAFYLIEEPSEKTIGAALIYISAVNYYLSIQFLIFGLILYFKRKEKITFRVFCCLILFYFIVFLLHLIRLYI
jgi:hypothetical protein